MGRDRRQRAGDSPAWQKTPARPKARRHRRQHTLFIHRRGAPVGANAGQTDNRLRARANVSDLFVSYALENSVKLAALVRLFKGASMPSKLQRPAAARCASSCSSGNAHGTASLRHLRFPDKAQVAGRALGLPDLGHRGKRVAERGLGSDTVFRERSQLEQGGVVPEVRLACGHAPFD